MQINIPLVSFEFGDFHFLQVKKADTMMYIRKKYIYELVGLPGGSDGKVSVYNVGDLGLIPGLGRSLGEGNGNPLQYYCLENPMDRGAW